MSSSIIDWCINTCYLSNSKVDKIETALNMLSCMSISLDMSHYLGMGGYSICFSDPHDSNSVIKIYFQCNIDEAIDATYRYMEAMNDEDCDSLIPIKDFYNHKLIEYDDPYASEYLVIMAPKAVSLNFVSSPHMPKSLHSLTVSYFEYMLRHNLYNLDVKTDNIGYNSTTGKFLVIDTDCHVLSSQKVDLAYEFTNMEIDQSIEQAISAKVLNTSTAAYALFVALKRFRTDEGLNVSDYLKVYGWLLGVHYYQEFIFNKFVGKQVYGIDSSVYENKTMAEVNALCKLPKCNSGIRELSHAAVFSGQALYVNEKLNSEAMRTDFSVDSLNLDLVRGMLPEELNASDVYLKEDKSSLLYDIGYNMFYQRRINKLYIPPPPFPPIVAATSSSSSSSVDQSLLSSSSSSCTSSVSLFDDEDSVYDTDYSNDEY